MRIDVSARNMDLTPAIDEYAQQKSEKLPRYYDGVERIEVVVEHFSNEKFLTEFRVDVEKHDTFVSHAEGDDVYKTIDQASDKMTRQLTDFKEKLRNTKR